MNYYISLYAIPLLVAYIDVYRYFLGVEKELKQNLVVFKMIFLPLMIISVGLYIAADFYRIFDFRRLFYFSTFTECVMQLFPAFIVLSFIEDGYLSYQYKSYQGIFKSFSKTERFFVFLVALSYIQTLYYWLNLNEEIVFIHLSLSLLSVFVFFWRRIKNKISQGLFSSSYKSIKSFIGAFCLWIIRNIFYYLTLLCLLWLIASLFLNPIFYEDEIRLLDTGY